MGSIKINNELCKGCELCVNVCPKKILTIGKASNSKGYFAVTCTDMDKCTSCAACAVMCPDCVIEVDR